MIYAKIYLDYVEDNTFIVVECATKNIDEKYCLLKGEHLTEYGDPYEINKTRIKHVNTVAISIEARDMFHKLLAFDNENKINGMFIDDFGFFKYQIHHGVYDGEFAFKPDKGSVSKRVFNVKDKIIIDHHTLDEDALELMQVYDNKLLKELDITEPVDEQFLKISRK